MVRQADLLFARHSAIEAIGECRRKTADSNCTIERQTHVRNTEFMREANDRPEYPGHKMSVFMRVEVCRPYASRDDLFNLSAQFCIDVDASGTERKQELARPPGQRSACME